MNNKEKAENSWKIKAFQFDNPVDYKLGISDFKAALIQAVEKEKNEYGNGKYYEGYERALNDVIKLINKTKPLNK
jgi:hypothetical protein